MARIAGVELPKNKRMEVALTYIYGIGKKTAKKILETSGVDPNVRSDKLSEVDASKIRSVVESDCKVEGDLRKDVAMNIRRLIEIGSYRGLRHRRNLPVRGQRTHTNARTRKGPRKTVMTRKKKEE